MKLNIQGVLHNTHVNGPGVRSLLHVQGCSLGCPGCFNKWSWPSSPNRLVDPEELAREILLDNNQISISGGEPMDQPDEMSRLVRALRELDPDCSILMFTGYTPRQLGRKKGWGLIRDCLDVLVAGPYRADRSVRGQPLVGSANQQILLLSNRHTMQDVVGEHATVEAHVSPDGVITITGFPPAGVADALGDQEEE